MIDALYNERARWREGLVGAHYTEVRSWSKCVGGGGKGRGEGLVARCVPDGEGWVEEVGRKEGGGTGAGGRYGLSPQGQSASPLRLSGGISPWTCAPTPCAHASHFSFLANEESVCFACCEVSPPLQLLSSCLLNLPPGSRAFRS